VFRPDAFPKLPATITILGPDAEFQGGSSAAKIYNGNESGSHDCPGADGSVSVPTVGVIGADSVTSAYDGVDKTSTYTSDGYVDGEEVVDISDPNYGLNDPMWTDCEALVEFARNVQFSADLVGDSTTPRASLGTPGSPKSVFIDGDYTIGGNWDGAGLLFVTGTLELDGRSGWQGPIFVIGEGDFLRDGNGNGEVSGGTVVADIAGPDRVLFTDDDCSGEDGTHGTADDGIAQSSYLVNGAGSSTTGYCGTLFPRWQGLRPFEIVSFRQR